MSSSIEMSAEDVPFDKMKSSFVESACKIAVLKATAAAREAFEAQKEWVNVPSPKRGDVCSLGNQLIAERFYQAQSPR